MPGGEYFLEIRDLARSMTRERFVRRVPWSFLTIVTAESSQTIQFETRKGRRSSSLARLSLDDAHATGLFPLVKTVAAYSASSLIVGRSKASDVWLPDAAISKQHARLTVENQRPVALEDLGSHNGTFVAGACLAPNTPQPVQLGDLVAFGSVTALLLDADRLHVVLCRE